MYIHAENKTMQHPTAFMYFVLNTPFVMHFHCHRKHYGTLLRILVRKDWQHKQLKHTWPLHAIYTSVFQTWGTTLYPSYSAFSRAFIRFRMQRINHLRDKNADNSITPVIIDQLRKHWDKTGHQHKILLWAVASHVLLASALVSSYWHQLTQQQSEDASNGVNLWWTTHQFPPQYAFTFMSPSVTN